RAHRGHRAQARGRQRLTSPRPRRSPRAQAYTPGLARSMARKFGRLGSALSRCYRRIAQNERNAGMRTKARLAKVGLTVSANPPHIAEMDDLRRMYAVMALRKPVRLSDGRRALITRVDTDFPGN